MLLVYTIATICAPIHRNTTNRGNLARQCPDHRIVESAVLLPALSFAAKMVRISFEAILLSIISPPEDAPEAHLHAQRRQMAAVSIHRPLLLLLLLPSRFASKACMAKKRSRTSKGLCSLLLMLPDPPARRARLWLETHTPAETASGARAIGKPLNVKKLCICPGLLLSHGTQQDTQRLRNIPQVTTALPSNYAQLHQTVLSRCLELFHPQRMPPLSNLPAPGGALQQSQPVLPQIPPPKRKMILRPICRPLRALRVMLHRKATLNAISAIRSLNIGLKTPVGGCSSFLMIPSSIQSSF